MEQDLTRGSVPGALVRFSLPLLGANLLQSLYNVVDMAVVGRFTGSAGLAAVSSAAMLSYIINALCTGVSTGGSVLVAQARGAGDGAGQRRAAGALFTVALLASAVITGLGLALCRPVFRLMNVPDVSMGPALDYMPVLCLGTVFVFGYNAVCAVLRGLGDSAGPLLLMAVATAVNVLLDLLLVGALGMGTRGAALATVCAQGISCLAALALLRRRRFPLSPCLHRPTCAALLRIGLPSAVQMAVLNLSYLLVTGMLNAYGVVVAAAAGVGLKINTFAAMPCWAVGSAVTTMAGQCVGAGDPDRARLACRTGVRLAAAATACCTVAVLLFAAPIVRFFDADPAVVAEGVRYLRICCSFNCLLYSAMYVYDAFATGAGAAWLAMLNALLQSLAFRLFFSWLLGRALGFGYVGIFWAEALSPLLPCFIGWGFFRSGLWRRGTTR